MTHGRCPTCGTRIPRPKPQGPRQCTCGRDYDPDDLHVKASTGAVRALWAAVRALEDKASTSRWRRQQPMPPPYLDDTIERAEAEAEAIRAVLEKREGDAEP